MKNKKGNLIMISILLGILIIIVAALLRGCAAPSSPESNPARHFDISFGKEVSDSALKKKSTQEIIDELNEQVAAGMITISMNTEPIFEDGASAGNLLIYNDTSNRYPQVVEIYRDDTGELIYTSGGVPVGKYVNEDTLDVKLAWGDYACTAYFNSVDPDTGLGIGTAGASITIHILN